MNEKTVAISIQARLEELLGGEEFERKLAQYAEKVQTIGSSVSSGYARLIEDQNDFATPMEIKENEKSRKAVEASIKRAQEYMNQTFVEFTDYVEDYGTDGLTKQQVRGQQRKFDRARAKSIKELEDARTFIANDLSLQDEDRKTKLEFIDNSIIELNNYWKGFNEEIKKFADGLNETNNTFMEMLKQAGILAIGGQALDYGLKVARVNALIEAKEKTSFDLTSPQGMYQEQAQLELFKETQQRSLMYSGIGSVAGGILGGVLGGGNPLFVAGGVAFGGYMGDKVAELLNIEKSADVESELKFLSQSQQQANQFYERYKAYEIPAKQLSTRFGEDLRGTNDLGYTAEQELQYKKTFGETLGRYDKEAYSEQLTFSRAKGLDPDMVMSLNLGTKFWDSAYGVTDFKKVEDASKKMFGEDSDNKRIIELLTAMKEVSLQQLQLDVDAKRDDTNKFLQLPSLLFGVDNAYGRFGEGGFGSKTLSSLQGMMNPKSEAHETFLFRALAEDGDILKYNELRRKGLFGYDENDENKTTTFEKLMRQAQKDSGGNNLAVQFMITELLEGGAVGSVPAGLIPRLGKLLSGEGIEVALDANNPDKKTSINLEQMFKILSNKEGTNETKENLLNYFKDQADNATTEMEKTAKTISEIQIDIGKTWEKVILDSQKKMAEWQEKWLTSGNTISKVQDMLEKGMQQLSKYLAKIGIYSSEEDITQKFHDERYNIIYRYNGNEKSLPNETLDEYKERTMQGKRLEYDPINGRYKQIDKTDYSPAMEQELKRNREQEEKVRHEFHLNERTSNVHNPKLGASLNSVDDLINEAGQKYGINPNWIRAIIKQESSFDAFAVSKSGAQGLMQLMPETAKELGVSDPFDIQQNIFGGTKYFRKLLEKYNGDSTLALSAYNAGAGNVDKYGGIPPFNETKNYVDKVSANFQKYEKTESDSLKEFNEKVSDVLNHLRQKDKEIKVSVVFENTPLHMMDDLANAKIGVY
jgi:hypothetical protein